MKHYILAMYSRSSLNETPSRKRGSKSSYGDKRRQPGAKIPDMDYVAYHGTYGQFGATGNPNSILCNDKDYRKREPLPLDIAREGLVTAADAAVIRQRNLPLLFHKQFSEVGRWTHPKLNQAYLTLFPEGSRYQSQEPQYRPNPGCIQTRFWSDAQVETWAKFADLYAIRYSGRTEYRIPKDLLGYHSHTINYAKNIPWPKPGKQDVLQSFKRVVKHRKRSEFKRIMRSLRKPRKKVGIQPLDIGAVIAVRRCLPKRKIDRMFDQSMPISEFRNSVPQVLSLTLGPPLQLSEIVMKSLRDIYSCPKKFMPDKSWLLPGDQKPEYTVSVKTPIGQPAFRRESAKLRPFFSRDGNIYALPVSIDNRHIFSPSSDANHYLQRLSANPLPSVHDAAMMSDIYQSRIDEYELNNQQVPGVLGSWTDW